MPMTITKQAAKPKPAKADPLFQTAQEVENLSKEDAFALADQLIAEDGMNDFKLGGALTVIHDKCKAGHKEWLEGNATFKELCDHRFDVRYRKAIRLINLYACLVEEQIPWEQVKCLRWSKVSILVEAGVLTKKSAAKWVEKVDKEKLTCDQLEAIVKKSVAGDTSKAKALTVMVKPHEETASKSFTLKIDTPLDMPKPDLTMDDVWTESVREVLQKMKLGLKDNDKAAKIAVEAVGAEFPDVTFTVEYPA
jgi:hypothetical protein